MSEQLFTTVSRPKVPIDLVERLVKHAVHDQSTHGNWARNTMSVADLRQRQSRGVAELLGIQDPNVLVNRILEEEGPYIDSLIEGEGLFAGMGMKEVGVLDPIVVRVRDDGNEVIWDGMHRLAAAVKMGLDELPVTFINESGEPIQKSGVISPSFGSKRQRRNELVSRLKGRRNYDKPVKGGKKKKRKKLSAGSLTSRRSATILGGVRKGETLSKHAAPVHPGTGTDQSVHGARKLTVEHGGETYTRTTRADYTHVSIKGGHATWHTSEELARKRGGIVVPVPKPAEKPEAISRGTRGSEKDYLVQTALDGLRRVYQAATKNDPEDKMGDIAWALEQAKAKAEVEGIDPEEAIAYVTKHAAPIHPGTGTDQSVHGGASAPAPIKWVRSKQVNQTFRYDTEIDGDTWSIRGRAARQPVQGGKVFGQWVGHSDNVRTETYDVYRNERIVFVADRLKDAKRYVEGRTKDTSIAKHPGPDGSDIHGTGSSQQAHSGEGSSSSWTRLNIEQPAKVLNTPCYRCGGAGGYKGWPGFTCFRCGGDGIDPTHKDWAFPKDWTDAQIEDWDQARLDRNEAARERRAERQRADAEAQYARNVEKYPELEQIDQLRRQENEAFAEIDERYGDPYYLEGAQRRAYDEEIKAARLTDSWTHDILNKMNRFDLTERQAEVVIESQARFEENQANYLAEREQKLVERANAAPFPSGKQTVTGTVLSTRVDTIYTPAGAKDTLKMLVETDDGNRIWGTAPAKILDASPGPLAGSRIRFKGTFEVSSDDEHFGFVSRPSTPKDLIEWFVAENNLEPDPDYEGYYRVKDPSS